ncbi:hypothetical protein T11_6518 [Trichinella zimbabwensis]|uniref:Uncharacterized protein n=1 Tax=Trichinella zimbabwensis TaxID=268475 RepID=A0A0V1H2N7_9BILA|nr:hypothetical protein T11_6518 [Trichinella zimbabwensis]
MIDRFTRWPEVVPLANTSADTNPDHRHHRLRSEVPERPVVRTHHRARYDVGTGVSVPPTNERNGRKRWIDALPLALLGIRSSVKEDLRHAPAELVYGSPLRLPGVFFTETLPSNAAALSDHLRILFDSIRPTLTRTAPSRKWFVSKELKKCTHVFVQNDAPRPPLSPTYDGPYLVLSRAGKTITILCQNKSRTISLDRVKPAFLDSADAPQVQNTQLVHHEASRRDVAASRSHNRSKSYHDFIWGKAVLWNHSYYLSTCGVSCLVDQVDLVVENVVLEIPSYGLRKIQQRFEDLRRENFSLKVSLSYAQLKLQELGATDVYFNRAESFDDFSAVKKQLAEKEIAFAKARKEWNEEIQIRDEKIMSLREKQRTAERVYQEAEILKTKCEKLKEEKEVYERMLKELQLSYDILLEQLKAANDSVCDDDGSGSMVLMSKKEAIILDLKTTIAHLEAELDEKCNKLKQYANIDMETLENCVKNYKINYLKKAAFPEIEPEFQSKLRQVYDRTKHLYSRLKSSAAALNAVRMKLANANGNELSNIAGLSALNEDILENMNATAAFISLLEGNSFSQSLINGGDGGGGTDNMFLHIVEVEEEVKQLRQHLDARDKHIEELDGLLKSRQKIIDSLNLELDAFLLKKESSVDKAVETEVVIKATEDKGVLCKLSFDPTSFDWPNSVTERCDWLPNFSCNFIQMLDLFAQITQRNDISDSKRDEYVGNLLTNMCETVLPLISQKNATHSTNGVDDDEEENESFPINVADLSVKPEAILIAELKTILSTVRAWCSCRDSLRTEEFEEELRKMTIALKMCISATNAICKINNNTNNANETTDSAKESLKIEPKKDCTANGTTEIDGKGILEVPDVGLKERNAKLEKYIKLLKGKFKKLEKYLIIGDEEVQLSKNSSLTDLDRLDRVEMLLRSSDTREKQLSATIEQLEQNNERLAEYVRTIEATVDDQSCWKNRCLDLQRKYDLAKLKIETLQHIRAVRMKLANANGNELSNIDGLSTLNEDILENMNATAAFISLLEGNSFSHSMINGGDGSGGTGNMFLHIVEVEEEVKQLRQHVDPRDKDIEELNGLLKSRQKIIDCLKLELDAFLLKKESSVGKAVETEVVIQASEDKVTERCDWLPNFSCNFIQMLDLFAQRNDSSYSKRDEYIENLLTNMCEAVLPLISQKNATHSTNVVEQEDDDEEENESCPINVADLSVKLETILIAELRTVLSTVRAWLMDDLAELLTSSQKNISIAMNQFVKLLSESKKPKEQQVNLSKLIKDLKRSLENVPTCNVSIGACIQDTNGSLDDILIENKHLQQMVQQLQQELDDVRGELCSTVKDFDDYKSLVSDANRIIKEDLKKTGKVLQKFKKK